MADDTVGTALVRLRSRSGMSLDAVARAAGYKGRSSVQRFFHPDYDKPLPFEVAKRLAKALDGKGNPTINVNELFTLAGVDSGQEDSSFRAPSQVMNRGSLARDVPVYGTALGGSADYGSSDGSGMVAVEQATLDQSEVLGHLRRPEPLAGKDKVYGVYIAGSSMYPRFSDGEAVYVDPMRPPLIGDDVIVHLCTPDDHDGDRVTAILIKRLVRRSASYIELEQFNPPRRFKVAASSVKKMHRIIPFGELLS